MTHDEDQDALAAEYVLGTLESEERAQAEARLAADADFAALVRGWERRLGELQAMVDPIEPPAQVWGKVKSAILAAPRAGEIRLPDPSTATVAEPRSEPTAEVVLLASRVRRWRRLSAATGALAAALLLFAGVREFYPELLPDQWRGSAEKAGGRFVAVLQQSASAPAFLLTVDVDSKTFTVRRVGAAPEPGKSHELWLVSDQFPQPRSLGVIGAGDFTTRPALASFDPETINRATYAVSLEPEGGSPTGAPTGPVLFVGKLVAATPP
jgi:anti-sigma-K factor RskA